ncbi:TldD/PmbA family protein [Bacteroidales bacterium Barb6]|nr:TldD/PmbA family protein [Bacteroidales bacterium Barb6]
MAISNTHKDLAQWAMDLARKNGCQASRISLYAGSSTSFEVRDMKIDRLQQAAENGLSICLFVDGRFGSYSTNRLDKAELEKFIKDGIDATRYLAEDKARTLPDTSLYYQGGSPDLQLCDPKFDTLQPDDKAALAMNACNEIMGRDSRIISANASFSDEQESRYMAASNGFEGETSHTEYALAAGVSIRGEGEARPEADWYDSSIFYDTLVKDGIGTKALERVLRKIGQRKTASGKYAMLLDNTVSSRVLSPLINALYGSAIQQNNSFLLNKLGEKVAGGNVTLTDEPHIVKAFGARYFDNEGVATRTLPVFENGVLKTYFIDTYYANKMKVKPTVSSPSVLTMPLGSKDLEALITGINKGIWVTGFNGGNNNSTSGDFSYGVEGFLIENGKPVQPVSEMNITGNILDLWSNLTEAGNDPRLSSAWRIPSLLFAGVDFSGTNDD